MAKYSLQPGPAVGRSLPGMPLRGEVPTQNLDQDVWVRPSDWVTCPMPVDGDQKIVGLHAIYPDSNFVSFTLITSAGFSVDWGDGTSPQAFGSGTVNAQKNIDWSLISSGTLTSRGYRQALITVTVSSGNLTSVNLNVKHTQANTNTYCTGWLSLYVAGTTLLTTLTLGATTQNVRFSMLERFHFIGQAGVTTCVNQFLNCRSLQDVKCHGLSRVANSFATMFSGCVSLRRGPDLSSSLVTTFLSMFLGCTNLKYVPSYFMPVATTVSAMFSGCTSLRKAPWLDTYNVVTFSSMFLTCSQIQSVPLYNTRKGTDFSSMFSGCNQLESVPMFDTSAGVTFTSMFSGCSQISKFPELDVRSGVTFTSMFATCTALRGAVLKLNTVAGQTFTTMFSGCTNMVTSPDLDLSVAVTLTSMFLNCTGLTNVRDYTTSTSLTGMATVFSGCSSLTDAPMFSNTQNVTTFNGCFTNCFSLQYGPAWNTQSATNVINMFTGCSAMISAPTYNFAAVVADANIATMFATCNSLRSVVLSNLGVTTTFTLCALSKDAIVAIFNALGTASKTITVSNNWGYPLLTGPDLAIATGKGWTVA